MKKEELLEEMETSLEALIDETERFSEEEFETMLITGTWSAKEIMSHIAAWDSKFMGLSKTLLRGESIRFPNIDAFNAREVSKRCNMNRKELIDEVRRTRRAYVVLLTDVPPEHIEKSKGTYTIGGLASIIISHDKYHLRQLKARKTD